MRGTDRRAVAVVVVAIGVMVSGCSSSPETEPVTIGELPDDVGPAITLTDDLDEYGSLQTWPSACDLVTDETLTALLPQIEQITRTPEAVSYEVQGIDLIQVPGGIHAEEARCEIAYTIPIGMLATNSGVLHIEVLAAGSPEFVELNLDKAPTTELDVEGGSCGFAADGIRCLDQSGRVHFRMSFSLPHHGPSLKDPSRYEYGGETVSFTTNSSDDQARNEFIDEHLTFPIMSSILARLAT
ncbi:hypothetical protein FB566_4082 [Stackebrandtia endophytica]|uniref:Lipoprotein n=1 Tax=Stackebrandtia endophytica TaxID=1496996 RepID=A0A543B0Z2_9ACTN|nr:hypothetical protein [Stackebrandtia endophytica]TQL78494.1 hypothetical protein FB566_4082 [Stackebrandtia endophytica]